MTPADDVCKLRDALRGLIEVAEDYVDTRKCTLAQLRKLNAARAALAAIEREQDQIGRPHRNGLNSANTAQPDPSQPAAGIVAEIERSKQWHERCMVRQGKLCELWADEPALHEYYAKSRDRHAQTVDALQSARDEIVRLIKPCSWPACSGADDYHGCDKPCYEINPPSPKVRERIAALESQIQDLQSQLTAQVKVIEAVRELHRKGKAPMILAQRIRALDAKERK